MLASTRVAYAAPRTPDLKRRDSHRSSAFYDPASPNQHDDMPSLVVGDLTLVSNDDSLRTVLNSPRPAAWTAFPAIEDPPNALWAGDVTLTSTPQCGRKDCSLKKPVLDVSALKEYPKSPPQGCPRADSLRTFASSMEVLETMSNSGASVVTLHSDRSGEGWGRKEPTGEGDKPTGRNTKMKKSVNSHDDENESVHTKHSIRKRGPSSNLREAFVQTPPRDQDPLATLDPRYAFEYQLTLAILDAMDRAPPRRPSSAGQSDKKSKRLSSPFAQTLGSLKRRVPSPRSVSILGL